MTTVGDIVRPLYTLSAPELAAADRRYPKWASMCRQRLLGLPVLNAVFLAPDRDRYMIAAAINALARVTGQQRLMLRSDGGIETRGYDRGGNSFSHDELAARMTRLMGQGRAVILLEPTNRFANRLAAVLRMDRYTREGAGQFTIEALGPGYDVADLTRGGIAPQVVMTVTDIDWSRHRDPWWSDFHLSHNTSLVQESTRRRRRLEQLATHVLRDSGDLGRHATVDDAERWLRDHGYLDLWDDQDIVPRVARQARRWFDDAFLLAACHPNRGWTCLATALSDLGRGRWVFWDVADGASKYGTPAVTGRRP